MAYDEYDFVKEPIHRQKLSKKHQVSKNAVDHNNLEDQFEEFDNYDLVDRNRKRKSHRVRREREME
jgi:predicted protein tyrosine phosphatase